MCNYWIMVFPVIGAKPNKLKSVISMRYEKLILFYENDTPLSQLHRKLLLFDAKYPLTSKNRPLYFNSLKVMTYPNVI